MPPLAVIFDLDGTLCDTLTDIAAAMNEALGARGLAGHPREAYRKLVGDGVDVLARRALPAGHEGDAGAVAAAFRERYAARLLLATWPYPGVPEMLAALAARGLALAVLSNKPHEATVRLVGAIFPGVPFAAVRGQEPGVPTKPDPTAAHALAASLAVAPARCVLVGDSGVDMQTARAAGMRAVGVLWGYRDRAELVAGGAESVVASPAELAARLVGDGRAGA
ncbi:MAG: HAD family hydrolase [Deltaproteobacteria bacterium]|nr:HAD family hydrolase [Deltaproteobacteria bacterium]